MPTPTVAAVLVTVDAFEGGSRQNACIADAAARRMMLHACISFYSCDRPSVSSPRLAPLTQLQVPEHRRCRHDAYHVTGQGLLLH